MSSSAEPQASPKKRRVSPFTVVGLVLLLAGLSCLGWVAYQYFGSNVVSERTFTTEKNALRVKWEQEQAIPATGAPAKKADAIVIPGDAIALLRIPALGDDYEIPILSGTSLDILSRGVGHYVSTAMPGQLGNFAVAGHRVTHGQPFSKLLTLNKGDQVIVETRSSIFTYVIDEPPRDLTVKQSASWVIDPVPGKKNLRPTKALMTLTTCQDLFHSPDRSIGFAHLASTKNKG